jgi:hypothetical protein
MIVVEDPGGAHGARFIVDPPQTDGVPMPLPGLIPGIVIRLWRRWLLRSEQRGRFFQRARFFLMTLHAAYRLFAFVCVTEPVWIEIPIAVPLYWEGGLAWVSTTTRVGKIIAGKVVKVVPTVLLTNILLDPRATCPIPVNVKNARRMRICSDERIVPCCRPRVVSVLVPHPLYVSWF